MKGDFTRNTFQPAKHYQQVLMQQGRVQLDADWNEQSAIAARRDETMLADLAGHCGGSAEAAAFAIVTETAELADLPADPAAPIRQFGLSSGRYYIHGLQCEAEQPFLFSWQPDHRETGELPQGEYLIYLDVWRRHLTLHEDAGIREAALGGPDTGTRLKTVWQVRAAALDTPLDPSNPPPDPCGQAANDFEQRQRAVLPRLAARTTDPTPDSEPCTVPAGAGYRGLENQLYRVEVHAPGEPGAATFKWSRENGAVVTRVIANTVVSVNGLDVNRLTVSSTGPDDHLGFRVGSLVEILHESEELEGHPGTLARVAAVDDATGKITLAKFADEPLPLAVDLASNPRLRRWEGFDVVTVDTAVNEGFLTLENGIDIRFDQLAGAAFATGDYWQIPARSASPDALSGKIEWPVADGAPALLQPLGIAHHYCRLAVVSVDAGGAVTQVSDCRCLWPALTAVPRLFYVGGDGQEVLPDLTAPAGSRFKLPRPLIAGVPNAHCHDRSWEVRFEVVNTAQSPSAGQVVAVGGTPTEAFVAVPLDADGLAQCDFHLDGLNPAQQVTARLLDNAGHPLSLPIVFHARLSVASQVAYQPGSCTGLAGQKTVQDAIAHLAEMVSLYKVSGDGQQAPAGIKLKDPLRVQAANRCGPVAKVPVAFQVILGGGSVVPAAATTDASGEAACEWQLGADSILQVVEAVVGGGTGLPVTDPRRVHFIAHLDEANKDPAPVRVVGLEFGKPPKPLANDQTLSLGELAPGLAVLCDRIIDADTVRDPLGSDQALVRRGQPTCFLTAEVPFPLTPLEMEGWNLRQLCAYRPLVLQGIVDVEILSDEPPRPDDHKPRSRIVWRPAANVTSFLARVFSLMSNVSPRPDRILLRLTLKGNFIGNIHARELFEKGTPGGFLDGDAFRHPQDPNLRLPSGDGHRGGDLEIWFWLAADAR